MTLNDLELRPEALDALQLPLELVRGFVGKIEARIPWGNPGSKPTLITVDDVTVLVGAAR